MRFELDEKFWVVRNPTPSSEIADVLFHASLKELALQFSGGLSTEERPTLFTDKAEAEIEARERMKTLK
jgi:hypothetical protein